MKKEKKVREDKKEDRAYKLIVFKLKHMGIKKEEKEVRQMIKGVIMEIEGEGRVVTNHQILKRILEQLNA